MTENLKQLVTEVLGLRPAEASLVLRRPLAYQSNRLYDLRAGRDHWIVKEFCKPDEFALAPRREYQALERLAGLDVAPRPVFLSAEPRPPLGPLVVYDYMPGQMWDRRRPSGEELSQLADIWLAFAGVPVGDLLPARVYEGSLEQAAAGWRETFGNYADWAEVNFPLALPAARLCQQVLITHQSTIQTLSRVKPGLTFGRGDSRFANIIARPGGRLGIVDWEDSGLTDPALALADMIVHANQEDLLSAGEWDAFLGPYLAALRPADPGLESRLQSHLAVFSLFWLSILIAKGLRLAQAGRLNGWLVNDMPANQRLRRYLARVLAWPAADSWEELDSLVGLTFFPIVEERS